MYNISIIDAQKLACSFKRLKAREAGIAGSTDRNNFLSDLQQEAKTVLV